MGPTRGKPSIASNYDPAGEPLRGRFLTPLKAEHNFVSEMVILPAPLEK